VLNWRLQEEDASLTPSLLTTGIESVSPSVYVLIDQKAIVILYVYFGEWNNGPLGAHALPYEVLLEFGEYNIAKAAASVCARIQICIRLLAGEAPAL
jgi:hypothetical protein